MNHPTQITLEIQCHNLPGTTFECRTEVRLGIQRAKEVVEDVPGDAPGVTFSVPLRLSTVEGSDRPNFLGPFAHGTPDDRFVYLSWGERIDGKWYMFRRAKIKLGHIGFEEIDRAMKEQKPLRVSIGMTDEKGGPLCGTVKDERSEWEL